MEKPSSRIENIQNLGVIESVIAANIVTRSAVDPNKMIQEFENHSKRLSPDERRGVLNAGFIESVAAYLEANSLPGTHPQKEYADLRAQTISEFMGRLGNNSGDVANVKAGKNADGTYKRIAPIHYKASLAVNGYERALKEGNAELAAAIKQAASHCFAEPLDELISGASSVVSTAELTSTLDKAKKSAEKTKGRTVQVLAATALSFVAVATTATPSAANNKAPEIAEIDDRQTNNLYSSKGANEPYKIKPGTQANAERVVIKEVGLSDVPAPEVNASPKLVDAPEATEEAAAAPALFKEKVIDTLNFTPEIIKADLPEVKKAIVVEPTTPKAMKDTFTPEIIKADLPSVKQTEPEVIAVPKEITGSLVPEIVKIDSGLDEAAPKVSIHVPKPEASTPKPSAQPPKSTPAPKPSPTPEAPAPVAAPEHIIDPALAGETMWSAEHLTYLRDHLDMYTNIEKQTGVEWEIIAALHYREASMAMANPTNGQGIFQLFSSGEHFSPGPITKEEFTRQGILAANFMKEKAKIGAVYGELLLSDPDKVKDVLFSYNGRASSYEDQARELGFKFPAEGSPYVMNLADDKRNSLKNPNWGQYLTDNAEEESPANQAPGAWPLIEGLVKINKIAHDRLTEQAAKQAAEAKAAVEAKKAAEAKAAEEAANNAVTISQREKISQPEKRVEEFTGWHHPVPVKSPESPQYAGHRGIDYAVPAGTPFYAAVGGTVKVLEYNVKDEQFCKDAFNSIGASMDIIKDPIQKEVRITRTIGKDTYEVIYAHMSEIDVEDGQIVNGNDQIGKTGNSGCSTGDHAHFEIRVNGVSINPNVLFIQGKVQPMGSVEPSSVDTSDAKLDEQCHGEGGAGCACGCGSGDNSSLNGTNEATSNNLNPEASRNPSELDAEIDAIQQVIEIENEIAAEQARNSQLARNEGYLSVQH